MGRQSEEDALYLNVTPAHNDGKTIYKLSVKDVPVDGFWSISVYDDKGHFVANPQNAYSLKQPHRQAWPTHGPFAIQFGRWRRRGRQIACRRRPDGTISCASHRPEARDPELARGPFPSRRRRD